MMTLCSNKANPVRAAVWPDGTDGNAEPNVPGLAAVRCAVSATAHCVGA